MLVGKRMTYPVITIRPDISLTDALKLMQQESIRRLPVVDPHGKLIGIVTERQLLKAMPSDATTLSVYEMREKMEQVKIDSLMERKVITVTTDTPIEEAARMMAEKKIGSLPVVDNGDEVVGIITETDIFKVFLEIMGAHEGGIRLTVFVSKEPGTLAKLSKAIFEKGGDILSMGSFMGETSGNSEITFKICGIEEKALVETVRPLVEEIVDVRGENRC